MARLPKDDDVLRFRTWGMKKGGFAPSTLMTYAASVRHVLSLLPDPITEEAVIHTFHHLHDNEPFRYGSCRRAWNLYCEFAAEQGYTLPHADGTKVQKAVETAPSPGDASTLPSEVLSAAAVLIREYGIARMMINRLRWHHVAEQPDQPNRLDPSSYGYLVSDPDKPGHGWRIRVDVMQVLEAYAQPTEDRSTALVPEEPGSPVPFPANRL